MLRRYNEMMASWRPLLLVFGTVACGAADDPEGTTPPDTRPVAPTMNEARDIVDTQLDISIAALRGSATITFGPSDQDGASLKTRGLTVDSVRDDRGDLLFEIVDGRLDVGLGASTEERHITVDYGFAVQNAFDGLLAGGMTLIWPYYCENLFPCHTEPSDGTRFGLTLRDAPELTVFPTVVPAEAPPYMIAWASGDYTKLDLGSTERGTAIAAWHLPNSAAAATTGTANLRAAFDYYERTLGPYPFGAEAGSVEVVWGTGAIGGMEHHPFWHVSSSSMGDASVHVHEAAHGWFGNGVRIACWEDFVLSEGTVSYLTARAIAAVTGSADAVWSNYQARLDNAMAAPTTLKVAWPQSCGAVDILDDGLFSSIPYMKGAFFFRALEARVGVVELDKALRRFTDERVGTAAGMQDLLDTILSVTGYDPSACAEAWLRSEAVPLQTSCP